MLFNSFAFLGFFPIAVFGYFLIPHRVRYIWLLICSYYFYMCWNPKYLLLLLASTVITWLSGLFLEILKKSGFKGGKKEPYKKICVASSLVLNLAILGFFKYLPFFSGILNQVLAFLHISWQAPQIDILLPVGISFYTFQALSYTMDVYRDEISAEKNFLRYALFVSFFPQLVAGPIERSKSLLGQINEKHTFSIERARSGLMLMLWGYFLKMVVADRIAIIVDPIYENYTAYPGWQLAAATALFAFQIYCDFAGYSTIAKGAGEIMGFRLTDNFNAPYFAQSVAGFWRRWHISLSSWFRDYVYIPLGGNRKGKVKKHINLMIVFLLSGLWHGAGWHFVAWGFLNGFYQVAGEWLAPVRDRGVKLLKIDRDLFSHKLLRMLTTFFLVSLSWVFFRANSFTDALKILRIMFSEPRRWLLGAGAFFSPEGIDWRDYVLTLASIGLLLVVDRLKCKGIVVRDALCRQELWFRWLALLAGIMAILVFGIWGSGYDAASFIYFQF